MSRTKDRLKALEQRQKARGGEAVDPLLSLQDDEPSRPLREFRAALERRITPYLDRIRAGTAQDTEPSWEEGRGLSIYLECERALYARSEALKGGAEPPPFDCPWSVSKCMELGIEAATAISPMELHTGVPCVAHPRADLT